MKTIRQIITCTWLAGLLWAVNPACAAEKVIYPPTAFKELIERAFMSQDFEPIEKMATELRTSKSRNRSGRWNLEYFYAQIDAVLNQKRAELEWDELETALNKWVARAPLSPTPPIVLAAVYRRHAWILRGTNLAETVTEQGRLGFQRYGALADATLVSNRRVSSADPYWYHLMIKVALEQGRKSEIGPIFEEGISKEPLFYSTYTAAMDSLLPQWGGNMQSALDLADFAANKTSASDGQILYALMIHHALILSGRMVVRGNERAMWPRLKAGFEDLLGKYPSPWNRTAYAMVGCAIQEEYDDWAVLMGEVENEVERGAWSYDVDFKYCTGLARTHRKRLEAEGKILPAPSR